MHDSTAKPPFCPFHWVMDEPELPIPYDEPVPTQLWAELYVLQAAWVMDSRFIPGLSHF